MSFRCFKKIIELNINSFYYPASPPNQRACIILTPSRLSNYQFGVSSLFCVKNTQKLYFEECILVFFCSSIKSC